MNYERVIKNLLLGIVFLVPLFILRALYDVFSLDKITLLRLLTLAILVCLILRALASKTRFKIWKGINLFRGNPLALPVFCYLIIAILATIFSVAPKISFFGFYKRYQGLSTLLIYIILFFLTIYFAREKKFQQRMFRLVFLAAFLMSVYGLMQYFEIDPFRWKAQFELTKAFSTFGNPNFLGAYLAMAFPLGLYLFLKVRKDQKIDYSQLTRKERRERERQLRKGKGQREERESNLWFLGIGLVLIYTCLLVTLNRGGILALFGALVISVFIIGWQVIKENKKRLIVLGIVLILITAWQGPALWKRFSGIIRIIKPKVALVREVMAQEKEKARRVEFLGSASERLWIWRRSLKIIKDYPWLGVGPDAMALVYWPYEKIGEPMTHRSLVDRAHNDFIDQAISLGLLGLSAYLWMIVTAGWMGWKIQKYNKLAVDRENGKARRLFLASILAGIAAYLIQNQLSFGVSGTSSLFWILMGLLVVEYQNSFKQINADQPHTFLQKVWGQERVEKFLPTPAIYKTLAIVSLLIILFLAFWTVRFFIADIYYKQGQISQARKEINRAIEMHKKAAKLNPFESFYQEGVSLAVYEKVKKTSGQEKIAWIKETIEETEKAIRLNPANGFFYNTMGVCHGVLAKQGVDREINEKKAIEFYKKAISLTPKLTEAYNNLALLLMAQGKLDEAQEKLKQALEIGAGRYGTDASSYKLGQKLLDQGKTEEAINLFKEVVKWRKKDTDALRNLAVAYSKAGQNSKAIEIFERVLEIDPKNDYAKKAIKKIKENVGISVN